LIIHSVSLPTGLDIYIYFSFTPSRQKELTQVGESLQTINEKLAAGGKDPYSPPEWMKTEKLSEEWTRMEEAEKKRDHALKLRLELAELQGLIPPPSSS